MSLAWEKNSLRRRMSVSLSMCVGICLLLLTVLSFTVFQMLEKNRVQTAIESAVTSISESFDESYYFLLQISQQMMPEGNVGDIAENFWLCQDHYDKIQYGKQLSNSVSIMMFASTDVTMAGYYLDTSETGAEEAWFSTFPARDTFLIRDQPLLFRTSDMTFHSVHPSQNRFVSKEVVSVCRPLEIATGEKLLIYVELYTNASESLHSFSESQNIDYTLLQLDEGNTVCYSSNESFVLGEPISIEQQSQQKLTTDSQGNRYVVETKKGRFGNQTALLVSYEQYNQALWFWIGSLLFMSCLVIAAVVCSLVLVTRLIYRPMQLLEREIEKVGKGDLSTTPHNKVDIKEFDVLFERIQVMKQEIAGLMEGIREQEKKKKELELSNLYYQINPHFLMNALNSVHWMAVTRGEKEIDSFIYCLNYILGYSLGKTSKIATFRTELQSLEAYVKLQQKRYDFTADYQVEQGAYLDYPCARLILQPVAENAVCHNMDAFGTLRFTMKQEQERWVTMTISDDGKGFEVSKFSQPQEKNQGIGLQYVRRCLEDFYGGQATMEIYSKTGEGTVVVIRVPLRKSDSK